jgi:hypothetical protein
MAGKGDVMRPMAVEAMTGQWPTSEGLEAMPCSRCGRDVRLDPRKKVVFVKGERIYTCVPKCIPL